MELFIKDSFLELNTKNYGNSISVLTIAYVTPFAKRFRRYKILTNRRRC
jgi:hypothetical protein